MNTIHIPAKHWPRLRQDVESIRKATKSGTRSFEHLAWLAGSRIYSCRYNELNGTLSNTMAGKDGRTIITEQNLCYFPLKVRFYFAQLPASTVFARLEKLLPDLVSHRSDLLARDYQKIVKENNSSPFIFCYRNSGTDLLHLMPTIEEMTHEQWFAKQTGTVEEIRKALKEYHLGQLEGFLRENKNFLHFDGRGFLEIPKAKAKDLVTVLVQRLCWAWKNETFRMVKIPSRPSNVE